MNEPICFNDLEPLEQVIALETVQAESTQYAKLLAGEVRIASQLLMRQKYRDKRITEVIQAGPAAVVKFWRASVNDTSVNNYYFSMHLLREVDTEFLVQAFELLNKKHCPRTTDGHHQLFRSIYEKGSVAQLTRIVRHVFDEDLQIDYIEKILKGADENIVYKLLENTEDEHSQAYYCSGVITRITSAVIQLGDLDLAVKFCSTLELHTCHSEPEPIVARAIAASKSISHIISALKEVWGASLLILSQALVEIADKATLIELLIEEEGIDEKCALIFAEKICVGDDPANDIELQELIDECTENEFHQAASRFRIEVGIRELRERMK